MSNILYFTRSMGVGGTENVVLQLCEIMGKDNKIIVCSCGGVNKERLVLMGIKHYDIPDITEKSLLIACKIIKQLNFIISAEGIDTVHTHHRMAAFYIQCIRTFNKFNFIHTMHNTFYDKRLMTRFALFGADLIAVGNKVKENLCQEFSVSESRITVIYNTVKPFNQTQNKVEVLEAAKKNSLFLVGNIGRLSKQKGMEFYIRSIPLVLNQCKNIKFFIVGDGAEKQKLEGLINDLEIKEYVVMMGYRDDIQNIMGQLDLIVLSSLWEGFPLTPIEAFSVGKTVVATAVDGTTEIVEDFFNGLLTKAADEKDLADKIIKMVNDDEFRHSCELHAQESYLTRFSYTHLKEQYINFYQSHQPYIRSL